MDYTVYGSRFSYFSMKLDAAMAWTGLTYTFQSRTMENRNLLETRSGTGQIPVLHTPENWMIADTTPLLHLLDGRNCRVRMFPDGPIGAIVALIEEWLDEWLPRLAVHYRWQYPASTAFASQGIAQDNAPGADPDARGMIAATITSWGQRACRATGITSEIQIQQGEQELDRLLAALDEQLGRTRYALGDRPCAVDAVLLGGLRAHFLLDPDPRQRFQKYSRVSAWAESATNWDGNGDLAPFPDSTPFARHIISEMVGPYLTFINANRTAIRNDKKSFEAVVYDENVSYKTRYYPEQSRQMLVRHLDSLRSEGSHEISAWIKEQGLGKLLVQ